MGADLYINKIYKPNVEKHQVAFRESAEVRDQLYAQCEREGHTQVVNFIRFRDFGFDKKPELTEEDQKWLEKLDAAQKVVDEHYEAMYSQGYFRDSYNATSLMWVLGISWWGDVTPMLSKRGNLTRDKIKKLLEIVKSRKVRVSKRWLKKNHASIDDGENSVKEWRKYYEGKRQRFIAFLEQALKARTVVHCSL